MSRTTNLRNLSPNGEKPMIISPLYISLVAIPRGCPVVKTEFVFHGGLRQNVEPATDTNGLLNF